MFVDYSRIQSSDAVSPAVANIGTVLGETLIDADAATAALKQTPTLIILDNLEALMGWNLLKRPGLQCAF